MRWCPASPLYKHFYCLLSDGAHVITYSAPYEHLFTHCAPTARDQVCVCVHRYFLLHAVTVRMYLSVYEYIQVYIYILQVRGFMHVRLYVCIYNYKYICARLYAHNIYQYINMSERVCASN